VPKAEVLPFEPKLNKDRFAIAKNQSPGEGMIEIGATMSVSSTFTATDGDRYEIQMGRWSRRLSEPFLDFTGVGDDERILDARCGTGSLTFAIPKRAKIQAAVGVDIAPAYIDHARRISTDDRLEFHVGDGCDIQYPDKSFDRVFSLLVLMFVPQPQKMIAEMCRVARPGATVAASVCDFGGAFPPAASAASSAGTSSCCCSSTMMIVIISATSI
jgi:SAM-dependent methyltransferase